MKVFIFSFSGSDLFLWFKSQRTIFGRLVKKTKSGQALQALQVLTPRQKWLIKSFQFLNQHMVIRTESRQLGKVSKLFHIIQGYLF